MAIKNTKLGGTDYTTGQAVLSADLNDTFDELYTIANGWKQVNYYD